MVDAVDAAGAGAAAPAAPEAEGAAAPAGARPTGAGAEAAVGAGPDAAGAAEAEAVGAAEAEAEGTGAPGGAGWAIACSTCSWAIRRTAASSGSGPAGSVDHAVDPSGLGLAHGWVTVDLAASRSGLETEAMDPQVRREQLSDPPVHRVNERV